VLVKNHHDLERAGAELGLTGSARKESPA